MGTQESIRRWVYTCSPIDFWPGWWTLADAFHHALTESYHAEWAIIAPHEIAQDASVAHWLATRNNWEGNGIWRVSAVPSFNSSLVYAVKQSNNGTTFIISPYRLPWLHGDLAWEREDRCDLPWPFPDRLKSKMRTLEDWVNALDLGDAYVQYQTTHWEEEATQ